MNSKNEPTVVLPFYVHVPIIGTLVKGVFTGVLFSLMSFTIDNVIIALEKPQTMTDENGILGNHYSRVWKYFRF